MDGGAAGWQLETCRFLIEERKIVGNILGFELCGDPAWDMLLELYLAEQERRVVYLWPLCIASHAPVSSAHRKVGGMIDCGLLMRQPDLADRRRTSVRFSETGLAKVNLLIERVSVRAPWMRAR